MQNLRLIEGYSYERMKQLLEEHGIKYQISLEPFTRDILFRDSLFDVDKEREGDVRELLSDCKSHVARFGRRCYYGKYQIEPGFDWSSLDGCIKFERGRLVERVGINFKQI